MSTFQEGVVIGVGSPIHPDAPLLGHLLTPDGDQLLTFDRLVKAQAYWNEHHKSSQLAPYFQFHTPCYNCGAEMFITLNNIGVEKLEAVCDQCKTICLKFEPNHER